MTMIERRRRDLEQLSISPRAGEALPERPAGETEPQPEAPLDRAIHAAIGRLGGGFSPMGLAEAWFDWAIHLSVSPMRMQEIAMEAAQAAQDLGRLSSGVLLEGGECTPCATSLPQDRRFRDDSWRRWPFAFYAEAFLSVERLWDEMTRNIHGATPHHLKMLNFVGRQALDIVAPSNFALTNPEVQGRTIATGGLNLLQGAAHAVEDAVRMLNGERPYGAEVFEPGRTVATAKGSVVRRTRLAEIIQYSPTTEKVRPEPIVIVPAWIMRYYILDLRPENSLVRHLVDEGFTVFMVSWKNPQLSDREVGFDDYRVEGVLPAIEAASSVTGAGKVHAVGYCIGGTLLSIAAAAMARDDDARLKTMTLLAAQVDFKEAGELQLFVDESQLAVLDDLMAEQGLLQASQMAGTFNLLRSNDLIWSRVVRQYLMGERSPLTDVAAWSTDATRMPARMHSEYLRALYLHNDLAEGRFRIEGRSVSLEDIRVPVFAVGTEWDHVAPWRSVYKAHQLFETDLTFCLTNGGHNQGIVTPPGRSDRRFRIARTRPRDRHVSPDEWLARTPPHEGSWWPAWFDWLGAHSGPFQLPPAMGSAERGLAPLEEAPGSYVHG